MSETYTRVFSIENLNLYSSYTVTSGTPGTASTASDTRTLKVASLPDDATVTDVTLSATVYLYLAYWAAVATINGTTITPGGSGRTVDLSSLVTGNGEFSIPFVFRAATTMTADGTYYDAMMCTDMSVTITYEIEEPGPEPPTPTPTINTPSAANRICIFEPESKDWTGNGIIMLRPTSCEVEEVAGGKFELKMVHPLSNDRRWKDIKPDYLIRAPVPAKRLSAIDGIHQDSPWESGAQLWSASSVANIYSKPAISQAISYSAWQASISYAAGDCVTYNHNNYRCTVAHGGLSTPPPQSSMWMRIANATDGGSVLDTLRSGDQFICLREQNASWLYIRTLDGSIYGYVQKSQGTKIRDLDSSDVDIGGVDEREIRSQMFRIYKVEIKREAGTIEICARHISYDFERNTLGVCYPTGASVAGCITSIQQAVMVDDSRIMATNIVTPAGSDGYTVDWSWKNPINALLDPDTGLVALCRGQCVRDNNDIFILANDAADKGYRISYGVNMTGITWSEDVDDVVTRVIPVGTAANGDPLLLSGSTPWVDSPYIYDYATIRCSVLKVKEAKVSTDMTEEQARALMTEKAQAQFDEEHVDVEKLKLKVEFVKLGDTVQFAQYRKLENLTLYDVVTITDAPLGIEVKAQMVEYKWDAILSRYISIVLGDPFDYKTKGSVPSYELSAGAVTFTKLSADAIRQIKEEVGG